MIKISAPGKLFLSGEWAVLETGNPGIVAAVNKKVFAEIEESKSDFIEVAVDDFGIRDAKAVFDGKNLEWVGLSSEHEKKLIFLKAGIESALQYLGVCNPFRLRSWGEMSSIGIEGEQKKIGFGSSAAAVVAAVAAIMKFNNHDICSREGKDRIYKLSAIAHYLAQGKVGSAFDVAASTYGGVFVYKRFDPQWLMEKMNSGVSIKDIVDSEWKEFSVENLNIPEGFELLVGWTKNSASTSAMVKQMDSFKENNREEYDRIFGDISNLVRNVVNEWKQGKRKEILNLIKRNEEFLRELGEKSGVHIETEDLKKLSELANQAGAAGKLSGAGGGDCGIAVCFDRETAEKVKDSWKSHNLYLIDAAVSEEGVKVEP